MCKTALCHFCPDDAFFWAMDDCTRPRSYRRHMRPRTARKASSTQRIALNRFWNEMEEFYSRREAEERLPAYTTDTFDHRREEAENQLNEKLDRVQRDRQRQDKMDNQVAAAAGRTRLESSDVVLDYSPSCSECSTPASESDSESSSFSFTWNDLSSSSSTSVMPSPPKTLPDLKNLNYF